MQSEHKKLRANYKKLKKENKEQADLLETASQQYDKANDYIRKKKEQEQLIKQLQEECQALREENKRLELTTKKMVRMQKERANQQRSLRPKKEHSGYVVLSQERIIREVVKGKKLLVYRTIFQSPYDAHLERTVVGDLFLNDFKNEIKTLLKVDEFLPDVTYYSADEFLKVQTIFDCELKQNFRSGFFEIIMYNSREFVFLDKMSM